YHHLQHPCNPTLTPLTAAPPHFPTNAPAPIQPHTLSLHDALPICPNLDVAVVQGNVDKAEAASFYLTSRQVAENHIRLHEQLARDRKSTRLNSSHQIISYAVFCLKKKKKRQNRGNRRNEVRRRPAA